MEPYSPGKPAAEVTRELGVSPVIKLASNENPLGPSPKAVEAVEQFARRLNVYPDASAFDLKQALARRFAMPENMIMVGNGSDELIHMIGMLFLGSEDDEMIVGDPSFVRYDAAAQLAPARLIKVPLDADRRHDLTAMARCVTERTKLVFVANPNNPTGTIVGKAELAAFQSDLPAQTTLVLDEAYFEFAAADPDYPDSADMVREGRNVIGLRTFSKAHGLAGIRMGFAFAQPEVVDAFNRAREPFNVNALAQVAAVAALGDDEHIRRTLDNNRDGMRRIVDALTRLGVSPTPSHANFVFADFHQPSRPIVQALTAQGVIIRGGDMFGTPTCARISVGTEQEVDRLIEVLESVLKEAVAL